MTIVVFEMVALGFEDVIVLVFHLPPCSSCLNNLGDSAPGEGKISNKGIPIEDLGAFPFSRSCYHQRERGISHLFQHVPASSLVEGAEHEYFLGIILTPKDTRPFEA